MDAEPDAENIVTAETEHGQQVGATRSGAASKADGFPEPDVGSAIRPVQPPRELTRRYTDVSEDDRDVGWGETPASSGRDDDWYLRERPPHHG